MFPFAQNPFLDPNNTQPGPVAAPAASLAQPAFATPFLPTMRPDTVLSQTEPQNAALQAWQQQMDTIASGGGKKERFEDAATDVFTRLVAPAMMAFGGPGTGAAGMDLLQTARQQMLDARSLRRQKLLDATQTAKGLTEIINNTSPGSLKALSEGAKVALGQDKSTREWMDLQSKVGSRKAREASKQRQLDILEQNNKATQAFKNQKLGQDAQQFQEHEQRLRENAQDQLALLAYARQLDASKDERQKQIEVAKLQQAWQALKQQHEEARLKYNNDLAMKAAETVYKDGLPVGYKHQIDGKMVQLTPIPEDTEELTFEGISPQPGSSPVDTILSRVQARSQQAPPPGLVPPPPATIPTQTPRHQAALEDFKKRTAGRDKAAVERERQMFMRALGFDPLAGDDNAQTAKR